MKVLHSIKRNALVGPNKVEKTESAFFLVRRHVMRDAEDDHVTRKTILVGESRKSR